MSAILYDQIKADIERQVKASFDAYPNYVNGDGRGHNFDEDAVCLDCGFDGAEWAHWKHHTWEGKASDAKRPQCTHIGRPVDVHPPRTELDEDDQVLGDFSDGCGEDPGGMDDQEAQPA
jgi:hypothetical protein